MADLNIGLSNNVITALSANTTSARDLYYNKILPVDHYVDETTIDDVSGRQMLEVLQKGIYKTLVTRRDDAKAMWEEEDDDASYGEYKALKEAVELLDAFIKQAPMARYSGLKGDRRYDRYGGIY